MKGSTWRRHKKIGGNKKFAVNIECCYSMHKRERHSNTDKGSSQVLVANTVKSLRPVQEENIQLCGMTLKQKCTYMWYENIHVHIYIIYSYIYIYMRFFPNKMSETFRNYNKICCHGGDHSE